MFQSAPPRGGRLPVDRRGGQCGNVSIRAPAWGATDGGSHRLQDHTVSIRAPAWGATSVRRTGTGIHNGFNPRPRVGDDRELGTSTMSAALFQSAPPRGGRLARVECGYVAGVVSIRAPAWGATRVIGYVGYETMFQSAPPRGGRLAPDWASPSLREFQSAPPRGGRPDATEQGIGGRRVSIRAPAWGATRGDPTTVGYGLFQSAPPRGGRHGNLRSRQPHGERFNPRPRVGGDIGRLRRRPQREGFNPRPRVGGAVGLGAPTCFNPRAIPPTLLGFPAGVSIRAPAWGATRVHDFPLQLPRVSIRAPAWGATSPHGPRGSASMVSIRAPAWGATVGFQRFVAACSRFNPRPRVGGDPTANPHQDILERVSIRAPAWGATGGMGSPGDLGEVSIRAPAWGATHPQQQRR